MTQANDLSPAPTIPVAALPTVLGALHDPVRLEMVRRLSNAAAPIRCAALYDAINKSTATHHFKILREAGLIERLTIDGQTYQNLRTEAVEHAVPGLLGSIVDAANRADTHSA
ncbi:MULTISPECIES: ArsR/SmtB family transcription factor [Nocardia]|uniref:ArsR/SmtB family transcription factor n=1 Tax=Nocardia TaxID=1817 RepID=UPI0006FAEA7A|nr:MULTISPECIES: transcriptional regulator [Nocardia]KQY38119.1 ArsR family transcriptional regulator [Nocardia sp. Root136]